MAALRSPNFEQESQPTNFREWREPCERCGTQTLVITITQGQVVRQLDLCPCQIPPEQQAKNERLLREWAETDAIRQQKAAAKQRTWDHQAHLRSKSAECREIMERQFPGAGCKDKEQAFDFCHTCSLKRKKRPKGAPKP